MNGAARLGGLGVLTAEAVRDALRRRFVFAIALVMVLGLLGAESCTDFGSAEFTMNQQQIDPAVVAGFVAPVLFAFQILVLVVLAGVLASDHLVDPLRDGTAPLWLARPVPRWAFAGARLAGVFGVAIGAGGVLLGGTGTMLVQRHDLAVSPALIAGVAGALGALVVSALAMTLSLAMGRAAALLLVVVGVPFVVIANTFVFGAALVSPETTIGGLTGAVTRFGPPLGLAIIAGVAPWNPHVELGDANAPLWRLLVWAIASVALLIAVFRRTELSR